MIDASTLSWSIVIFIFLTSWLFTNQEKDDDES